MSWEPERVAPLMPPMMGVVSGASAWTSMEAVAAGMRVSLRSAGTRAGSGWVDGAKPGGGDGEGVSAGRDAGEAEVAVGAARGEGGGVVELEGGSGDDGGSGVLDRSGEGSAGLLLGVCAKGGECDCGEDQGTQRVLREPGGLA